MLNKFLKGFLQFLCFSSQNRSKGQPKMLFMSPFSYIFGCSNNFLSGRLRNYPYIVPLPHEKPGQFKFAHNICIIFFRHKKLWAKSDEIFKSDIYGFIISFLLYNHKSIMQP